MEALNNKSLGAYKDGIYADSYDTSISKKKSHAKSKAKFNIYEFKKYFVLSSSIVSLILIITMVLGYTEMVEINSNNKLIQYENENLQLTIDALEIKLKPYANKERIEKIASNRLGMIYPKNSNIVRLKTKPSNEKVDVAKEDLEKQQDKSLLSYVYKLVR